MKKINKESTWGGHFSNKKIIILLFILLGFIVIGTSFALWQLTFRQTGTNVITTGCFNVTLEDGDAISLNNTYPMTDEEGLPLMPYFYAN